MKQKKPTQSKKAPSKRLVVRATIVAVGLGAFACQQQGSSNELSTADQGALEKDGIPVSDAVSGNDVGLVKQPITLPSPTTHSPYVPAGYACVKHWEFETQGGDTGPGKDWEPQNNNVNGEFQHYLNRPCQTYGTTWTYCEDRNNAGKLELAARNLTDGTAQQMGGAVSADYDNDANGAFKSWGSGKLVTKATYSTTYGYVEVAAKLPVLASDPNKSPLGTWPSFFLLGSNINEEPNKGTTPWPGCGEIDLFEYANGVGGKWANYDHHQQGNMFWGPQPDGKTAYQCEPNLDQGGKCAANYPTKDYPVGMPGLVNTYHIYAIKWTTDDIRFYVDGVTHGIVNTSTLGAYDKPFYLQTNHAVGGAMGGNQTTGLDGTMITYDFVRVYKNGATEACGLSSAGGGSTNPPNDGNGPVGTETFVNSGMAANLNGYAIQVDGTSTITQQALAGTDGIAKFGLNAASSNDYKDRLYQAIKVTAGKKYDFFARMRKSSAGTRTVRMVIEKQASPNTRYCEVNGASNTCGAGATVTLDGNWKDAGFPGAQWTAPATETVLVGVYAGGSDLDIDVDWITFREVVDAPATNNLFTNPNFDEDLDGWTVYNANEGGSVVDRIEWLADGYGSMLTSAKFYSDYDAATDPVNSMQLFQNHAAVLGDAFTLKFDVSASASRQVTLRIGQNGMQVGDTDGNGWTQYGTATCNVGTTVTTCSLSNVSITENVSIKLELRAGDDETDFTVDNAVLLQTAFGAKKNLLANSTFDTQLTGWSQNVTAPAAGTISWNAYQGGIVFANMTTVGTNRWDSRIYQDVNTVAGKTYVLSVDLRLGAAGSEAVAAVVEKNGTPYTKYIDQTVTLTGTDWVNVTQSFTAAASESVRVQVMLGQANANVRIDNFTFIEQ